MFVFVSCHGTLTTRLSWSSVSTWYNLFEVVDIDWGAWVVPVAPTFAFIVLPLNDKPVPAALCVLVSVSVQGMFTTPLPDESTCKPYVLPFVDVTSLAPVDCTVLLNNFNTPVAVALAALAAAPVIVIVSPVPLDTETVEKFISRITRSLEELGQNEIASNTIGTMVMEGLKELDPVAYVRFASVYKNFREVKDFEDFLGKLDDN